MMHKSHLIPLFIQIVLIFTLFAGCNKKEPEHKILRIGITQIVSHPGIDAVREGFIEGMKDKGYENGKNVIYDVQNAQGSMNVAMTIAEKFKSERVDLIFSISTPSTQAVAKATKKIPIVFGAITDPVSAGVVETLEKPGRNVTGVSDAWPYKAQLELLLKIVPNVKRLGVIYNPGESNSVFALKQVKNACKELNLELITAPISNSSEVYIAAKSLIGQVDAFYTSADNTILSSVESLIKVGREEKIPVLAGESDSVRRGALATLGTNYYEIGKTCADVTSEILKGKKPKEIPVALNTKTDLFINLDAARAFGVNIPKEIQADAETIFENERIQLEVAPQ